MIYLWTVGILPSYVSLPEGRYDIVIQNSLIFGAFVRLTAYILPRQDSKVDVSNKWHTSNLHQNLLM